MKCVLLVLLLASVLACVQCQSTVSAKPTLPNTMTRRALHHVLKIGDRKRNIEFFRDLLGMTVLRHEEFTEQCEAQCNGPYDGKWSKTMVGYGPETDNFVLELTYNYGVAHYKLGNDLVSIQVESKAIYEKVVSNKTGWLFMHKNPESIVLNSPDGFLFEVHNTEHDKSSISKVSLLSSNLEVSKNYWHNLLGINLYEDTQDLFTAAYSDKDAKLELVSSKGQPVRHEKAFGRIAFACPEAELAPLQSAMIEKNQTILTKLVSLDTPGKATVQVVILADPDGYEICFVGEPGFDDLSQVDPKANQLLIEAIEQDQSDEWFKKKGIQKESSE